MEQERQTRGHKPEENDRSKRERTKRTGGSLFSNPWIYLLFILAVSAILAALCWTAANDVLALNKPEHSAVITIEEDDSYSNVVDKLKEGGIIQYKTLFRIFSSVVGAKDKIAPGAYELNTDMDYRAIINGLSANSGQRMAVMVTIPEGYTLDQIFQELEDKQIAGVDQLQEMAANYDYAFSFLEEIPLGDYHRLEGYLFPDTYSFYMGEDPKFVINKMLVNFDSKVTDSMRTQIQNKGYSLRDIIIIASMIEKETDDEDREKISSVIYNRMNRPAVTGGKLQIDATIQYVLPEGEKVSESHYDTVDSPYNTYKYKGLPPGPIANPGIESIVAAMNPADTKYYYYALGSDQKHHFFETYAEHEAFLDS